MTSRAYQTSHPWISFSINLDRASPRLWALLGQAVAFCEQVSGAVLPPRDAQKLYRMYLVKGARATTAIENNTLTEGAGGPGAGRRSRPAAVAGVLGTGSAQHLGRLQQHLRPDYGREPSRGSRESGSPTPTGPCSMDWRRCWERGSFRGRFPPFGSGSVGIEPRRGRTATTCWTAFADGWTRTTCRAQGRERPKGTCLERLRPRRRTTEFTADVAAADVAAPTDPPAPVGRTFQDAHRRRMAEGILKATLAHLYIAWIHPYGDGNGRTARLVEYLLLARAGIPFPSAHLMSNHFNLTRNRYYRELDRSSRVDCHGRGADQGDAFGFMEYAVRGFVDGLAEQCRCIEQVQLELAWEHFVFQTFRQTKQTPATRRRREVVLALSPLDEPVRKRGVPSLTSQVARMYADRTGKTLTRDLNWLVGAGLIERGPEGYRARMEQMKAFRAGRD